MHNLNVQPNLEDAKSLKRFKGCYLLESVNEKISSSGWPVHVAIIRDVERNDSIELRLLGNNFKSLNQFLGDYIQLEAAIKRYRNGYFYYLAWYESVTDLLMVSGTKTKKQTVFSQINRDSYLRTLRNRILNLPSNSEQSLCLGILNKLSNALSTYSIQALWQKLPSLNDNQLIIELVNLAEIHSHDISAIGTLLSQLHNKQPYEIWEQQLLGR
ncbi:hypothetical protein A8139_14820 [Marinomonas primoryensis]|uniref:Uncharacterized protein n=1 Tax=Marinomonas primoryensis TaxID=178399 RepID=A0A2Z4PUI9_9GAMM|nr:hypothetical protein [Marinomonas primoryensis]AWY01107.1 hypothetical protein A8139_14820 [Marinomonas primoryensis]